jgi:hypothetical protein
MYHRDPQDVMSELELLFTCSFTADPETLLLFALCDGRDANLIATSHPVRFLSRRNLSPLDRDMTSSYLSLLTRQETAISQ